MSFTGRFAYNNKSRIQYVVRYKQNGYWNTKYFTYENSGQNAQKKAMAFWSVIRNSPGVEAVTRVQALYN